MNLILVICITFVGGILIYDGRGRVENLVSERELNPLELKESPYGEIIGAALQEPVHLLSHGGIGHEHVGDDEECLACGVNHSHEHPQEESFEEKSWLAQRKSSLRRLEAKIRQNHNPSGRKAEARAYERKRIWELMELAYAMDPTNFGNYSIYVDLESREGGFEKILEISEKTLKSTEGRLNDPNDALTAAAAAERILIYREVYAKREGIKNPQLEDDYKFFIKKTEEYTITFDRALEEGRLEQFSQEKVDEMIQNYGYFTYTINAYKKYIDEKELMDIE